MARIAKRAAWTAAIAAALVATAVLELTLATLALKCCIHATKNPVPRFPPVSCVRQATHKPDVPGPWRGGGMPEEGDPTP